MKKQVMSIIALVAVAACSEAPAGPSVTDAPSFNSGNSPAASGQVIRFEGSIFFLAVDEDAGLQAWHGRDVVSLCQGSGNNADVLDFQVVTNPQEASRLLRTIHGDAQVSVWPAGVSGCAYYSTATPLATGTVNFRMTDNDVAPFNRPDPKNRNAFGYMANGSIDGASGESLRYAMTSRGNWDGSDGASLRQVTNIRLH